VTGSGFCSKVAQVFRSRAPLPGDRSQQFRRVHRAPGGGSSLRKLQGEALRLGSRGAQQGDEVGDMRLSSSSHTSWCGCAGILTGCSWRRSIGRVKAIDPTLNWERQFAGAHHEHTGKAGGSHRQLV